MEAVYAAKCQEFRPLSPEFHKLCIVTVSVLVTKKFMYFVGILFQEPANINCSMIVVPIPNNLSLLSILHHAHQVTQNFPVYVSGLVIKLLRRKVSTHLSSVVSSGVNLR